MTPRLLWGVLLLATWAGPRPCAVQAEDSAATVEGAQAAALAGRHDEARALWQALLDAAQARGEHEPAALAPLQRGLARSLLALGETYAALEPLERASKGGQADDRRAYADALLVQARANAERQGATAGQVMPYLDDALRAVEGLGDPTALRLTGEAHYQAGRLAEAVESWQRVPASPQPDGEERWYRERLAHALYLLGHHAQAAQQYESLGQRRGASAAWAAARQGEKALDHTLALLGETPGDSVLLTVLLEEALTTARLTGMERQLEQRLAALESSGDAARAAYARTRARLLLLLGDPSAAAALLRSAVDSLSGAPRAETGAALARTLLLTPGLDEGGRDEVAAVLLTAWSQAPGGAELVALMTTLAQQDFAAAPGLWPDRRPLERSVALQEALAASMPDDPAVLSNLGNTLRLLGRGAEAVRVLREARRTAPGDAGVTNDLGLALLAHGEREAARAAFEESAAEDPSFLSARQNLARVLLLDGEHVAARRHLSAAQAWARRSGQPGLLYRFLALRSWLRPTAR